MESESVTQIRDLLRTGLVALLVPGALGGASLFSVTSSLLLGSPAVAAREVIYGRIKLSLACSHLCSGWKRELVS